MSSILFLDDDPTWQAGLRGILEASGHRFTSAKDLDGAKILLREMKFDVVVFDLFLTVTQPVDDPFIWVDALISGLKASGVWVPPIILVTAHPVQQPQLVRVLIEHRWAILNFFDKTSMQLKDFLSSIAGATALASRPIPQEAQTMVDAEEHLSFIRDRIDDHALRESRKELGYVLGMFLILWVCLGIMVIILGWDTMEPIIGLLGVGGIIAGYAFYAWRLRELSPKGIHDEIFKRKKQKLYSILAIEGPIEKAHHTD